MLPFTRTEFLDVFAAYNERLWGWVVLLWLVTAYAIARVIQGTQVRTRFVPALLAVHWLWAAIAYHAAFFSRINPAAWVFSGMFLIEAGLLLWFGVVHDRLRIARPSMTRRVVWGTLLLYGLLYPVVTRLETTSFVAGPTFGVPCPTTIITIGFLLALDQSRPTWVTLIPILWSFIGGSAAFLVGVHADLMLLAAGVALIVDVIRIRIRAGHWVRPILRSLDPPTAAAATAEHQR